MDFFQIFLKIIIIRDAETRHSSGSKLKLIVKYPYSEIIKNKKYVMDVHHRNFEEIFLAEKSHPATVPDKNSLVEVSRRVEAVIGKWTFLIDHPLPFDIITPNFVLIKVE